MRCYPATPRTKPRCEQFLRKIEEQYGKAERVWLMDRGVPTEEVLSRDAHKRSADLLPGWNSQGPPE